ncbi:MAG: DNA translocase FtsK 4TM domain-containing protein, partial [Candidatus Saccharibacteria bacterium]
MAKKKKTSRKKIPANSAPQHSLPSGFWAQVGAVFLVAVSLLFVVAWFNAGGPVLNWLYQSTLDTIGYAVYVTPVLFIYVAVEIFRADNNRLPFVMKLATITSIVWFAGLFGLLNNSSGQATGGSVGNLVNSIVLTLVNGGVAAFIYVLLILITILFIVRVSPFTVIHKLWELARRDVTEQEANVKVMRNAAAVDGPNSKIIGDFKLNANVPTFDPTADGADKKQSKLSSLKNSIERDKVAEEKAALVTVRDPNWEAPSLDLLEKKQSPADAGDVQQNARIIKETLREFDIDVEMEGANIGPKVTQYTLRPPAGVKLTRISALEPNMALNLAAQSLRIEAPIPGRG